MPAASPKRASEMLNQLARMSRSAQGAKEPKIYNRFLRSLFYVAMTRARRSLAITTTRDQHPIAGGSAAGLLQRAISPNVHNAADPAVRYQPIEPQMVDLSWTGWRPASDSVHQAIARLQTDDPITLTHIDDGRWLIRDMEGVIIGRMAQSYRPPEGLPFIRGEARAIIQWRKTDNGEEFQINLRHEAWEVVLPEFVFERLVEAS